MVVSSSWWPFLENLWMVDANQGLNLYIHYSHPLDVNQWVRQMVVYSSCWPFLENLCVDANKGLDLYFRYNHLLDVNQWARRMGVFSSLPWESFYECHTRGFPTFPWPPSYSCASVPQWTCRSGTKPAIICLILYLFNTTIVLKTRGINSEIATQSQECNKIFAF